MNHAVGMGGFRELETSELALVSGGVVSYRDGSAQRRRAERAALRDSLSSGFDATLTGTGAPSVSFYPDVDGEGSRSDDSGSGSNDIPLEPGADDDIIVVTGAHTGLAVGTYTVTLPDGLVIELPFTGLGDFGEGETNLNEAICEQETQEEQTDFLATLVEGMIKQQTDWDEREYGALIYYDTSGNLKIGTLTPGTTVAEAAAAGHVAPSVGFSVPSDLGPRGIVAAIHNHPDVGYNNAEDLINHYPSYNGPSDDSDYRTFQSLVGIDNRFASAETFSLYVLGPDGTLREFDLKDGQLSAATDTDPNSRDDIYDDEPVCPHSGES